jgi:phosphopantothenoylcysteine decarboxylase/phosphopantothenate--cysteine ligase, prokaryotic
MNLKGKNILLGVSGGIAAYKTITLASMLIKEGASVQVIMTKNATQFVTPLTFEEITKKKCLVDTFDRNFEYNVQHIEVAKAADVVMVAPASANVIAKLVHGIADDMLTTTILACTCKKILVPAMNTNMYENPITQDNLELARKYDMEVVEPKEGMLACGDVGIGKMPEPQELMWHIFKELAYPKDMLGDKVLITAGPTREAIDPVRFITNYSTGKMGYALAKICMLRGADVTLVTGATAIEVPPFVKVIEVVSAKEMFKEVTKHSRTANIIIKAAAVADYRPVDVADEKIKKKTSDTTLELEQTDDILKYLGEQKAKGQFLCGFAMETQNMLENAREKLQKKNLDMLVANNLKEEGAGFGTDTNVVTILTKDKELTLEKMTKEEVAVRILDNIKERILF